MSNSCYKDAKACCPFYNSQVRKIDNRGKSYIKCENPFNRGHPVMLFYSTKKLDEWLGSFCNSIEGCKECEMYQLIIKNKYFNEVIK